MSNQHCLIGKTIVSIELADDKKAIRFVTDAGEKIIARADGDCCSDTWIEHVSLPALGLPGLVTGVRDLDMPDAENTDDGVIAFYGCAISTDKGEIVIDYRNESNGYYGGDLTWPDEYFYGGVRQQNVSSERWVPLQADI